MNKRWLLSMFMIIMLSMVVGAGISFAETFCDKSETVCSSVYLLNNEVTAISSYEAESDGNTIEGGATIADNSSASGGKQVNYIGGNNSGTVVFHNIQVETSGNYTMKVYYCTKDTRSFYISVNEESPEELVCPSSSDWNTVSSTVKTVYLEGGRRNTIKFDNGSEWAPNLDRIMIVPVSEPPANGEYEAEDMDKYGKVKIVDSTQCSGQRKVTYLGDNSGAVTFTANPGDAGYYKMDIYYCTADQRSFYVRVNSEPEIEVKCSPSGGWGEVATTSIGIALKPNEDNTITLYNANGWCPDLDKIRIQPASDSSIVDMTNGRVRIEYDLMRGTANFYAGDLKVMSNFYSGVDIGPYITSTMYSYREYEDNGYETVVTCYGDGYPTMKQYFYMDGTDYFLCKVEMEGADLSSNWMGPIVVDTQGGVDIGIEGDNRALFVPFDNDKWIKYNSTTMDDTATSYEVSAFFDNTSRKGLVVGSVTHDTWKTGVYFSGSNKKLNKLNVFGGANSFTYTHDIMDHGKVSGDTISSPMIFAGYYRDWRNGMEEFAEVNTKYVPKLEWNGGIPFGWNSWGKLQSKIDYEKAITVSDFIKNELQSNHFYNDENTVYVNLDSYWDNLSDSQLEDFINHCHNNGQKAGVYWAPFVWWGKNLFAQVEGCDYQYKDIVTRTGAGIPQLLDGGVALDPTHPGTKARINYFIDKLNEKGFDYIKLDYLGHGALEGGSNNGTHYDPNITTGIQAYNYGMQYVLNRINDNMFVSLSIAPLFPYQYGHGRRIGCDAFGSIKDTEYTMNSLTYGWWMNDRIYEFNDPDHMVLEGFDANENKSRVISGAICGTVFLNGDDLTKDSAQNLAKTYLTKPGINRVARMGKTFRAVEGNTHANAADVFVLLDDKDSYIAVFNYGKGSKNMQVELERAGLNGGSTYTVTDLWTEDVSTATGTLNVNLNGKEAKLFKLSLNQ